MTDEDDLNLPRAAINKLIKETLPQVRICIILHEKLLNFRF